VGRDDAGCGVLLAYSRDQWYGMMLDVFFWLTVGTSGVG
jgi:hypothetical protein